MWCAYTCRGMFPCVLNMCVCEHACGGPKLTWHVFHNHFLSSTQRYHLSNPELADLASLASQLAQRSLSPGFHAPVAFYTGSGEPKSGSPASLQDLSSLRYLSGLCTHLFLQKYFTLQGAGYLQSFSVCLQFGFLIVKAENMFQK